MKLRYSIILVLGLMCSCATKGPKILGSTSNPIEKSSDYKSFKTIGEYSKNKKYGLSGKFPVKVGGQSVKKQRAFLAALAGPNGEELQFHRRGSCCAYKSENAIFGKALVDVYEVTYKGLKKPIVVYISFYDFEKQYIPNGFTRRK